MDGVRKCIGENYWLLDGSVLAFGDSNDLTKWHYTQLPNGNYKISHLLSDSYEQGEVSSLIPLRHVTPLLITSTDRSDTLWTERYDYSIGNYPFGIATYEFYKSHIAGKVYEYYEVDAPPTRLNGDSLEKISTEGIKFTYCYNEPGPL